MNGQTREASCPPIALWRAMADASSASIILVSAPSGRILYSNEMGRLLAHDSATRLCQPAETVLPHLIADGVERVRQTGQPFHQHSLRLPQGPAQADTRFWDIAYTALPAGTLDVPAILITGHDVTHHVLARQAAEQARDTLDALLDHIPEGITIAYGNNVCVERVSAAGIELARQSSLDLIGLDAIAHGQVWNVYRPGEDSPIPPGERPLARAIRTGALTYNETMIMRRPDGTDIPLLCSAGPIRNSAGTVIGAVLCWRDITDIVATQTALAASEARLRAILEQIPAAIFIIESVDGRPTFQNARLDTVLANPRLSMEEARETLRGWALHADGTPYRMEEYPSRRAFSHGEMIEAEPMMYRRPDGQIVQLEMHAGPIRDNAGKIVAAVGIVNDVTERRRQEEALREALAMRELLVREADHRIKNSLQLICSILALQKTRLATPELRAALDDAISRVQAVAEAHRALHQSIDLRSVDFGTMLNDLCRHAATLSPAIAFICHCPTPMDLDTERAIPLGLIVSELLTNASKYAYGAEGGPVTLSAAAAGGFITITVADQGRGIPAGAGARKGIGSRIITSIARQIGATVDTASGPDGTAVTLSFPQQAG